MILRRVGRSHSKAPTQVEKPAASAILLEAHVADYLSHLALD